MIDEVRKEIQKFVDAEKGKSLQQFFKTGKGEYGEHDVFLGLTVPQSRNIAKMFGSLGISEIKMLLHSAYHEERLIALFILVDQYKKGNAEQKKLIYYFYLANTEFINNWDLVDSSADKIVGEYLVPQYHAEPAMPAGRQVSVSSSNKTLKPHKETNFFEVSQFQGDNLKVLVQLAKSDSVWEKRIAILSTFAFIRSGNADVTYEIADILLHDKHDLIHKAVGWLLREAGKKVSEEGEERFLQTRYQTMPRTMLRYAIERFPKEKREKYLKGEV